MKRKFFYTLLLIAVFLVNGPLGVSAADLYVSEPITSSSINAAFASAKPGDVVIIPDGTYDLNYSGNNMVTLDVSGTLGHEITLKPETPGGVIFTGSVRINSLGDYLIIRDFKFQDINSYNPAIAYGYVIYIIGDNNRITNNYFKNMGMKHYSSSGEKPFIIIYSLTGAAADLEIDHNTFDTWKYGRALYLHEGANLHVHHNYITSPDTTNAQLSAFHLGGDNRGDVDGNFIIEYNYFYDVYSHHELIANKISSSTYRYNGFKKSHSLTLRGGEDNVVDSNYFFDTDSPISTRSDIAIRVFGAGNTIKNNYIENTGPGGSSILVGGGDWNHDVADNTTIINNTIVNSSSSGINIANNALTSDGYPDGLVFKNNLISQSASYVMSCKGATNMTFTTNLHYDQGTATYWLNQGACSEPGSGITEADPDLIQGDFVKRLQLTSTNAIGKGTPMAEIVYDIEGHVKDSSPDIGADEYSTANPSRLAITKEQVVGPSWVEGFIAEGLSFPAGFKLLQ